MQWFWVTALIERVKITPTHLRWMLSPRLFTYLNPWDILMNRTNKFTQFKLEYKCHFFLTTKSPLCVCIKGGPSLSQKKLNSTTGIINSKYQWFIWQNFLLTQILLEIQTTLLISHPYDISVTHTVMILILCLCHLSTWPPHFLKQRKITELHTTFSLPQLKLNDGIGQN